MNYPGGIKRNYNSLKSYGNRGMDLESDLNDTNTYYLNNDIAIIYKKPTPITINKVDYKSRRDAVITEAHFKIPSTTDYNGIYKGKYIDFEAKETKGNNFPLANIHKHQIDHLNKIKSMGGIGFIIVLFVDINEFYLLTIDKLDEFIKTNTRKSIPLEYFKEYGSKLNYKLHFIDYLSVIDKLYF
jgi:recombination protein U